MSDSNKSSWKDKWKSIQSKYETCTKECVTAYRSDAKCKDSIEAILADIWNLRDWLKNDPSVKIPEKSRIIDQYIYGHILIRACGDIEIKNKHFRIDDERHENTELILKANHHHPSGLPVIYSVVTRYKDNPKNIDQFEDATDLARRAIREWAVFLKEHHLL